jgi:hypothetical protein
VKFEKLQPGMTVYDVHRHKLGSTTMNTVGVWKVRIVSVDNETKRVTASWNGNPVKTFFYGDVMKWREKEPLLIHGVFGSKRLATREELKAARAGLTPKDTP